MTELLTHWASKPFEFDQRRSYSSSRDPYFKPLGFWFDVDEDWKRWCQAENFRDMDTAVPYDVQIDPEANILRLANAWELDMFTEKYPYDKAGLILDRFYIDWPKVQCEYQGIIIAPYCWSRRIELMWYYTWDCASGCVWDLSALTVTPRVQVLA